MGGGIERFGRQYPIKNRDGISGITPLCDDHRQIMQSARIVWPYFKSLPIHNFRFVDPAGPLMGVGLLEQRLKFAVHLNGPIQSGSFWIRPRMNAAAA